MDRSTSGDDVRIRVQGRRDRRRTPDLLAERRQVRLLSRADANSVLARSPRSELAAQPGVQYPARSRHVEGTRLPIPSSLDMRQKSWSRVIQLRVGLNQSVRPGAPGQGASDLADESSRLGKL
jgi:hypothetical protein